MRVGAAWLLGVGAMVVWGGMSAAPLLAQSRVVVTDNWTILPPWGTRIIEQTPFGSYDLLGGYSRVYYGVPQPSGHRITPTGPNGYIYEPVYEPIATAAAPGLIPAQPGRFAAGPLPVESTLEQAAAAFRAGRHAEADRLCEAIVATEPRQGMAHLLQSHALFALGRFDDAAAALRRALLVLPESEWSRIVGQYRQYYVASRYTDHLGALERHVASNMTDSPARFLLGYHAGMLGYAPQAANHLAYVVQQDPHDDLARRLLDRWYPRPAAAVPPAVTAPPPAPRKL